MRHWRNLRTPLRLRPRRPSVIAQRAHIIATYQAGLMKRFICIASSVTLMLIHHFIILAMPEFCGTCHPDVVARLDLTTPHDAAEDCSACHSAHERIQIEDVVSVCVDCHDIEDHPQLAVSPAGACTTCHDPHGSGAPSLIASNLHSPFEEGDCESCHDPDDPDLLASNDLCLVCHDEPEPSGEHRVLQDSGSAPCIGCHSPHASGREFLLRGIRLHTD